jgi:uncharacterized protein (DUF427 family)
MSERDGPFMAIEPNPHQVRVLLGGVILAESKRALTLREGGRPPVLYIPRADVVMGLFEPSPHVTTCPHKGEASYFSAMAHGIEAKNVAWSYENPLPEVADIMGYLAFDPRKVDAIEELN